ncbi:PQQ-like beta-propeller repeat protein [Oceanomicrobium pacificus]|uniref:PQQ-binding-like beta-propeller repeat protein n=1 Tax=Oceanomicrobium pacificus TaxID=2692916 RepID=A0A6B0TP40_9RHOB|nr:PQQ-like beta-propeller repeat protein [Oceanomicrobium pacificus]MXU65646.1 PQQ-binding-like beta-propeller repeat protein [Oceanomicrobium pacificus]
MGRQKSLWRLAAGLCMAALVAGCAEREPRLPGERQSIRPADTADGETRSVGISLPSQRANASWTHVNGSPSHTITHPALSASPQQVWSVDIGTGSSKRTRLITTPVVADGRIFVMDAAGQITAVSRNGQLLWTINATPAGEDPIAGFGGGFAYANGRLFATTGFGQVLAINPASGAVVWRQQLDAPVRSAPVAANGVVIAVSRDDVAHALDQGDGRVEWIVPGAVGGAGLVGGSSPAVRGPLVVLPYSSGELVAALTRNGLQVWNNEVSGARRGLVRGLVGDISSDPVINFDTVYAANQAGQLVSINRRSGRTNWAITEGAMGPVWPVGGSIFFISDEAEFIRASAATGDRIFTTRMTEYFDSRKRNRAVTYFGPVLAGGRFWIAASDGVLRGFSPANGALNAQLPVPGGAATAPVVAGGLMFVVSADGQLIAFQ